MIALIIVVCVLFLIFIVASFVLHHRVHKEKEEHTAERHSIVQPIELSPIAAVSHTKNNENFQASARHGNHPQIFVDDEDNASSTLRMSTQSEFSGGASNLYGSQQKQANPLFRTSEEDVELTFSAKPLFKDGDSSGLSTLSQWAKTTTTDPSTTTATGARFTAWANVDNDDLFKGVQTLSRLLRTKANNTTANDGADDASDEKFIVRYLGNSSFETSEEEGLDVVLGSEKLFGLCQTLEQQGPNRESGRFKLTVVDGELQLHVHGTIRRRRAMDYQASLSSARVDLFESCFLYQQAVCLLVRETNASMPTYVLHMYHCKNHDKSNNLQIFLSNLCRLNGSRNGSRDPSRGSSPHMPRTKRFDGNAVSLSQHANAPHYHQNLQNDDAVSSKYLDIHSLPVGDDVQDDFSVVTNALMSPIMNGSDRPHSHLIRNKTAEASDVHDDANEQLLIAAIPGVIPSSSPESMYVDDDGDQTILGVSKFKQQQKHKQMHVQSSPINTSAHSNNASLNTTATSRYNEILEVDDHVNGGGGGRGEEPDYLYQQRGECIGTDNDVQGYLDQGGHSLNFESELI